MLKKGAASTEKATNYRLSLVKTKLSMKNLWLGSSFLISSESHNQ